MTQESVCPLLLKVRTNVPDS